MKNKNEKWFYVAIVSVFVLCAIYWYIAIFQYNEPEMKKDPSQGTQGINVGKNDVDGPMAPLATTEDGEPVKNDKDSPAGPWDGSGDGFRSAPPVITDPEDEPIDAPAWSGGQ